MTSIASSAVGGAEQVACNAAHAGTATGLGGGIGLGLGLGVGVGVGVGLGEELGLGLAEGVGLWRATTGPLAVQPATAIKATMATTPRLTEIETIAERLALREPVLRPLSPQYPLSLSTAFSGELRISWSGLRFLQGSAAPPGLTALLLIVAACASPTPFTATVTASATQHAVVGGRAQLVVKLTNTGPAIPRLGLVFRTADKWYEHHTVSDLGGCTVVAESSAFDCGELKPGQTASFSIVGAAKDTGTFHYELALRVLVQPFDYVNDHSDGAEVQTWDETITPS